LSSVVNMFIIIVLSSVVNMFIIINIII
jgi:hypothetical protein